MASVCLQTCNILFLVIFLFCKVINGEEDYYNILGIHRNANNDEIRRAYRRLAREWHPDKNTKSDAQETFIKINKAYETLSDAKKRGEYDRYGESGPPKYHEQQFDFFRGNGYMFFGQMPRHSQYQDLIMLHFYKKTILPGSSKKLYLLQIVSNWCMNCVSVEEIWTYTARDLKNHGVGTGTVNKDIDPQLARLLGVRKLPDFVAIINGKLYHYNGVISMENLKNFVSELFSTHHLVPEVTDNNIKQFLTTWYDNKPRALLFTTKREAPLLLKVAAFKYQHYVGIGFAQVSKSEEMRERFGAAENGPTFMIFKENVSFPHLLLQSSDLQNGVLDESISKNLFLHFPRLSSQVIFETLCPAERSARRKSLCVILFTNESPNLQHSLPSMAKDKSWRAKRIHFVYVNPAVQHAFQSAIKMNEKSRSTCKNRLMSKKVAILWRVKDNEVKYTWFENGWCGPKDLARLADLLDDIYEGEAELELNAVVSELYNEHAKSIPEQVEDIWRNLVYYLFHYFNWSGHLPTLSLAVTFGFVFLISFVFPSMTEKDSQESSTSESQTTIDVYGLVQLNSVTQDKLLHRCQQGQLVVVLLSDATSASEALRSPIVQMFANVSRRFLKGSNFRFGWLSIPEHIAWCNEVMKVQTFGEITAGTVLALNGAKKYLSIFKITKYPIQDAGNVFDDSDQDETVSCREDNDNSSMVFQEDKRTQKRTADKLGQQLPRWIEKLLEGMVTRIKVDSWPRLECDE